MVLCFYPVLWCLPLCYGIRLCYGVNPWYGVDPCYGVYACYSVNTYGVSPCCARIIAIIVMALARVVVLACII